MTSTNSNAPTHIAYVTREGSNGRVPRVRAVLWR